LTRNTDSTRKETKSAQCGAKRRTTDPPRIRRIKIKNLSQTKNGACNVFIGENSVNVQSAENETKYVDLHGKPTTLHIIGSTELEVTYER
jgi:hypothetical protein